MGEGMGRRIEGSLFIVFDQGMGRGGCRGQGGVLYLLCNLCSLTHVGVGVFPDWKTGGSFSSPECIIHILSIVLIHAQARQDLGPSTRTRTRGPR